MTSDKETQDAIFDKVKEIASAIPGMLLADKTYGEVVEHLVSGGIHKGTAWVVVLAYVGLIETGQVPGGGLEAVADGVGRVLFFELLVARAKGG